MEFTIDLGKITIAEYRSLFKVEQSEADGDAIIGKAVGLTGDEVGALTMIDYKRLLKQFYATAREPLADPN